MEDNIKLTNLIQEKKYKECIEILKQKIIQYVVEAINEKDIEYEYTNIIDLIEMSQHYITDHRKNIAKNIEFFSFQEDELITLERMLEICNIYDIK